MKLDPYTNGGLFFLVIVFFLSIFFFLTPIYSFVLSAHVVLFDLCIYFDSFCCQQMHLSELSFDLVGHVSFLMVKYVSRDQKIVHSVAGRPILYCLVDGQQALIW